MPAHKSLLEEAVFVIANNLDKETRDSLRTLASGVLPEDFRIGLERNRLMRKIGGELRISPLGVLVAQRLGYEVTY
jgi:hypothetical protein